MSALMITISTGQALTFGLTLIGLGMLVQAAMYRFLDERDESLKEHLLVEAQDESIALTAPVDVAGPCGCRSSDACTTCGVRRGEHSDQDMDPFVASHPQLQVSEHPFGEGNFPEHYADYCNPKVPAQRDTNGEDLMGGGPR